MRRAERRRGGEVIDHLRDDARPVDRVDARQPHPVAEGVMVEQTLHQRLAVVEGAFDRERMDVVVVGGGHHPPLHVGDAALRKQHEQIGPLAAAERLDRGAAGVAGGRHDDGGALAARRQRVIHQPRQQLHGDVLEGERRAVEQLEQEGRRRRTGRAAPPPDAGTCRRLRARAATDPPPRWCRRRTAGSPRPPPRHRAGRQSRRWSRAERLRPGLRHIEAAVAGEPRERDIHEAERRGLAAGGDVAHERSLERGLKRLLRPYADGLRFTRKRINALI